MLRPIEDKNLNIGIEMTESKDVTDMITELDSTLIKPKNETKPRKIYIKDCFIMCYAKKSIYREMTPFELTR